MRDSDYIPQLSRRYDGRGSVRLNGRDFYFGKLGDWPKGRRAPPTHIKHEYDSLIARWLANGRAFPEEVHNPTVNDLLLSYDKYAERRYQARPLGCIRDALRVVKDSFGRALAVEFGPKKLKEVRRLMVAKGWSRSYVNAQVDRVRRAFRWAVGEEMIPGEVDHALSAVPSLRRGEEGVRESKKVTTVADETIEATLPFMPVMIQVMVRVQRLTGARPGEVCLMRACDIDRTDTVWVYRPEHHKTEHHDLSREILIGPRAQDILRPWLEADPEAYLFSPAASETARNVARRAARKSAVTPSQAKRERKPNPKRVKRDRYDATSYRNAVYRACDKAFPAPEPLARRPGENAKEWKTRLTPDQFKELGRWKSAHHWHPNRIRHSAGSAVKNIADWDTARIVLGHTTVNTTRIYVEEDRKKAIAVVAKIG